MKISESILQAVDTIVSEKLNQLHFDITETCVVIGLEDEIKGRTRSRREKGYQINNSNLLSKHIFVLSHLFKADGIPL